MSVLFLCQVTRFPLSDFILVPTHLQATAKIVLSHLPQVTAKALHKCPNHRESETGKFDEKW